MTELINSKIWTKTRFTVTGATSDIATRKLLVAIKNQMIFAGWEFVSSSDSISSGATDYWADETDIVIASEGTEHSWVVLQNSCVKTGFQICINIDQGLSNTASFFMSPSIGFSGGSIRNRPTAGDEVKLKVSFDFWLGNVTTSPSANIFTSSDLKCTRIFLSSVSGTAVDGLWIFDVPKDCPSWVDNKIVCMVYGNSSTCGYISNYDALAECWATMCVKGEKVLLCLGTLVLGTTYLQGYAGVIDASGDYGANWPCTPIWLLSTTTSRPGIYGTIYDLWWAPTTTITTGDYFPGDGSKIQFVFRNMVQGNDGTSVTL
jgi:hypothetical protein